MQLICAFVVSYAISRFSHDAAHLLSDPMSKIQAVCKCKKLSQSRAIENAFSKVLLVVLPNGKATVEIDTTKPDFNSANYVPDDQLVKV